MNVDWIVLANVTTGFASVVSLAFVAWQLRSLARQTKASTDAVQASAHLHTFTSAVEIDKFFVAHPGLRRRFYGELDGNDDQDELQRIDATAEMLLDQFMMAATQIEHMTPELRAGWKRYVGHVMARSPALRDFHERNKDWYDLIDDIDRLAPPPTAEGVRSHRLQRRDARARPARSFGSVAQVKNPPDGIIAAQSRPAQSQS